MTMLFSSILKIHLNLCRTQLAIVCAVFDFRRGAWPVALPFLSALAPACVLGPAPVG